jgi:asparagine synthetase B (glutamine-hydrolysing)
MGLDDSAEIVRLGASPLRRRDWHEVTLTESRADRVALSFCGERGGVAADPETGVRVALDGEILTDDGVRTGVEAAADLLGRHLANGEALAVPEGSFAAAVWDPRSRSLHLVRDRFGQRPLYVARYRGGVLAASELKALVAAGVNPELDLQAWAEMLAFEYPLADSVPLAGVRIVPQASTLTLDEHGRETVRERWRYRVEPDAEGGLDELVPELGRLLERAVSRRLTRKTGLALSAGLDSRSLAAVVREHAPASLSITYGAPGSEDFVGGAEVARRLGLPHRAIVLDPGYIARGAAKTVWLGEGHVRCFHVHHLHLSGLRAAEGLRSILIGFAGDVALRGFEYPLVRSEEELVSRVYEQAAKCVPDRLCDEVFTSSFAAEIRGRARAGVADQLAREEGDFVSRRRQNAFRHNRQRMLWGAELFADDLAPRDPFQDIELIDFCRRMPEWARIGGELHRAYLTQFHELAGVSSPKDGFAPALRGRRRHLAALTVRARRGVRARLDARLGPGWRASRRGLGDYASDLRQAGADLLSILFEPRTLGRGQLREQPVRRLVDETLRGRARHTHALGMLLTLELFQRQFLEGEPPGS